MTDFYETLGIGKNASKDEIKRAYRRLAQQYHPDKGGEKDEQKFREINEAYEVLSDDTKRAQYDQFGQTFEQARRGGGGFGGFSGFNDFSEFMRGFGDNFARGPYAGMEFDFGDIFSDIFGTPRGKRREQGVDLEMILQVEFLESVFGSEKEITIEKKDFCPACRGEGAQSGSKVITCPKCHGQGQITTHRRTILGSIQHIDVCDRCQGRGKVPEKECSECLGAGIKKMKKNIKVVIPSGIDHGQRIKLSGEGEVGYRGSRSGDLYIVIHVKPHAEFSRQGYDILSEIPVSFYQVALGAKIEVNTVDGPVMVKVPAGTQSGKVLRLRGKGVPHLGDRRRGDHLVTARVVTPSKLNRKEKEIFKKLAEEKGESVDIDESLWGKIKDSF